ncbi:hypothetical protein ACFWMP_25465 [Paenibacillus sp. NPDC058367]|uniref:hypothetical protein n=1 Tax=Paenibacillus sp. NPDC058367 TaxID=3346460 RepID=UPI00365D6710
MKLGERVGFYRYYKKSGVSVDEEHLTEEQQKELDDNDCIVMNRLKEHISDVSIEGIICGKRRRALRTTFEFGNSSYNPDSYEMKLGITKTEIVVVYLVASKLSGFYLVPSEWLKRAGEPNEN